MAILPTKDAIVRFDENEDRLNTFINEYGVYTPNSGLPTVETLPSFMQRNSTALNLLASTNVRGAWASSTVYSVWDEVQYSGTWYRCVVAHTSTGTFDSTKWRISQGITASQLEPVFDSISALRSNNRSATEVSKCRVSSYYGTQVAGQVPYFQGFYYINLSDTTSSDNGGSIIVDAAGNRWYLSHNGKVSVTQFGARPNIVANQASYFNAALSAFNHITIPEGIWYLDWDLSKAGRVGYNIEGDSTTTTIFKSISGSSKVMRITGGGTGYNQYSNFSNFTIDMVNLVDTTSTCGLTTDYTWGNNFKNITIINHGVNNYTYYGKTGTYTSTFSNCDLGSVSGKVRLQGNTLSDAVTTITFTDNTSMGSLIADMASTINCFGVVIQGSLNKFVLSNVNGINVFGGDFEGSGVFLQLGSGVDNLHVYAPTLNGFNGTFRSGDFIGGAVFALFGGEPFYLSAINGVLSLNTITEENKSAGLTRKVIKNSSATPSIVDIQVQNSVGSHFEGLDSSGNSYLDNRASGKISWQQSGVEKFGILPSNRLLVETSKAAAATAGSNGAVPSQVAGYIVFESAGTVYKIPYYNN